MQGHEAKLLLFVMMLSRVWMPAQLRLTSRGGKECGFRRACTCPAQVARNRPVLTEAWVLEEESVMFVDDSPVASSQPLCIEHRATNSAFSTPVCAYSPPHLRHTLSIASQHVRVATPSFTLSPLRWMQLLLRYARLRTQPPLHTGICILRVSRNAC
jgi:hypothetical protein